MNLFSQAVCELRIKDLNEDNFSVKEAQCIERVKCLFHCFFLKKNGTISSLSALRMESNIDTS